MTANVNPKASAVRELAAAVEEQNTALSDVASQIGYLKGSEARSRNFLRLLAITLLFDVCLSIGLGFIALRSNDASRQARHSVKVACAAGNDVRAQELKLWSYVLDVSSSQQQQQQQQQHLSTAQKTQQAQTLLQFRAVLNKTFAPRDCSKV